MKYKILPNITSALTLLLLTTLFIGPINLNTARADTYEYQADVKGMVCAFCAYSVAKNINKLAGVNSDSINVDLKNGKLKFLSIQKIDELKLSALFKESGFTISKINYRKSPRNLIDAATETTLDLTIDVFKLDQYLNIIEAIGNIATSPSISIVIEAPASYEDTLLKPLLMGRQQVIKVRFIPVKSDTVHLQLINSSETSGL